MNTETRPGKPVLLWFDCCQATQAPEVAAEVERHFVIARDVGLANARSTIERLGPRVLACDFDFPDRAQLRLMQTLRRSHPGLPLLMLTVQHSEALAVWALRNRAWNYYVKPPPLVELRHDLEELRRIVAPLGPAARPHGPYWPAQDMPAEVPAQSRRDRHAALRPAVHYVKQHFRGAVREADVAALCGMTRFEFSRAFHRAYGLTYIDYVLKLRIREAKRLLRAPGARVTEVCFAAGFNDASYFGRVFRQHLGVSPATWARLEEDRRRAQSPPPAPALDITATVPALRALTLPPKA